MSNTIDTQQYLNRDLSWLKFNERVLFQAQDSRVPLLERARFLAIFSSNLDEFFMKRVGYLKRAVASSITQVGTDHYAPAKLLVDMRAIVLKQIESRQQCYEKQLLPELIKNGVHFLKWGDLTEDEKKIAKDYYFAKVFPLLTPLAVDKAHPFPFLSNLSVSLGIILNHPKTNENMFARVKIPDVLPQLVQLHTGSQTEYRLLRLRDLIAANLDDLFPEMNIQTAMPFRITRNADVSESDDDDDIEDRVDLVEEELRMRRMANIIRLEHSPIEDTSMLKYLCQELSMAPEDVYQTPGEISYHSLPEVANLNLPKLRYKPYTPAKPSAFQHDDGDIFSAIREKEILVHHPFEGFQDSVIRFVREAVNDPEVLAIKITLYRAGENNPIIPLLVKAAEKGKQVVCVIELKARFDEARNIYLSEMLEEAGVHVVYGILGKKVHSKSLLVIRREGDSYAYYSHIGTGNYNPNTAKLYTDLSLFTSDKRVGAELIEVFNYLTGLSLKKNYQKLLVSPINMRKRFIQYIKKEIEYQSASQNGHIIAKMNSLEDQEIIQALYQASQAGVKIDLIVRGFSTLRPGVDNLSKNIRVISIVGRLLEHSRMFYFRRGSADPLEGKFYIGSADWMYRNLDNRIETIVPVESLENKKYCYNLLQSYINDQSQAWDLLPTGDYVLRKPDKKEDRIGAQESFILLHGSPSGGATNP
jgi:polyphosphate kinase